MTARYRVTVDLTPRDFGLTPLAHLHAILHSRLADGDDISGLTVIDARDLSGKSVPDQKCDTLKDS